MENKAHLPMVEPEYEESTYAEQEAAEPEKQDNSDVRYVQRVGSMPDYYTTDPKTGEITEITRAAYKKYQREQVTRVYQRIPMCGHKFAPQAKPRHRNCESCWFTFFQVHGEFTQSVEELYAKHGKQPVTALLGETLLHNFLKFMSSVAAIKAYQEAQAAKTKELSESTSGIEQGTGDPSAATEDGTVEVLPDTAIDDLPFVEYPNT